MNKTVIVITMCMLPLIQACDVKDPTNKPKTQVRTMIIGGMPAHDRDFKISQAPILAANYVEDSNRSLSR